MKPQHLVVVVLPLIAGGGAYWYQTTQPFDRAPILEVPETVDVGECEPGKVVTANFTLGNRGRGLLHLEDFTTNCGCTVVEQELDGGQFGVSSVDVEPGHNA